MQQRTIPRAILARRSSSVATAVAVAVLASLAIASSAWAVGGFAGGLSAQAPGAPAAPEVTNVVPATGPPAGGTSVGIGGKNLSGATEVDFGSTPASFFVKSASRIEAVAPPGSEGTVDVTVTTPEGTSAVGRADHYSYVPPGPAVVELTPDEGLVEGGRAIKILGAHFEGVTSVSFGGAAASFEVISPELIAVTTPPGNAPTVDVRVTSGEGTSPISAADEFHYRSKTAEISGVSPPMGPAIGGHTVAISGIEFYGVTALEFGSAVTTDFVVNSPTSISAVVPAQTAEKVMIRLATTFGRSYPEFCARNKGNSQPQLRRARLLQIPRTDGRERDARTRAARRRHRSDADRQRLRRRRG